MEWMAPLVPPFLALVGCLVCLAGVRRAVQRECPEVEHLAEEMRLLIERGEIERARSRLREARGPLASVLGELGVTWDEVRGRTGVGVERIVHSAASSVGAGWDVLVPLLIVTGSIGAVGSGILALFCFLRFPMTRDQDPLDIRGPIVLSLFAAGSLAGRFIASSTSKLLATERRSIEEQILGVLPSIHVLTRV